MAVQCPHCGESSVSWEGYDIQEDDATQRVCRSCGAILEEGNLQSDAAVGYIQGYQNVPVHSDYMTNGTESMSLPQEFLDNIRTVVRPNQISEGHLLGKNKIKSLFQMIGVIGKHLIPEAVLLYNRCLKESSFFAKQHLCRKELLAGGCVLLVCRDHDIPLTVTMICMMLNCQESSFNSEFFKLQRVFDMKLKKLEIDSYVEKLCDGQPNECVQRTKQVLAIARKTWLTEGCYRDALIQAANFYSWLSLEFHSRFRTTLKVFVKNQGWKWAIRIQHRCKEIGELLCSLASGIPWLANTDVNRKNVSLHLKDIIAYQKSLFRQIEAEMKKDVLPSGEENHSPDVSTDVNDSLCMSAKENISSDAENVTSFDLHLYSEKLPKDQSNETVTHDYIAEHTLSISEEKSTEGNMSVKMGAEVQDVESQLHTFSEKVDPENYSVEAMLPMSRENSLSETQSGSIGDQNAMTNLSNKRSVDDQFFDEDAQLQSKRLKTNPLTLKTFDAFLQWPVRRRQRSRGEHLPAPDIPFHPNIDSETVGEDDIPECDMDFYIKKENEMTDHALLRRRNIAKSSQPKQS